MGRLSWDDRKLFEAKKNLGIGEKAGESASLSKLPPQYNRDRTGEESKIRARMAKAVANGNANPTEDEKIEGNPSPKVEKKGVAKTATGIIKIGDEVVVAVPLLSGWASLPKAGLDEEEQKLYDNINQQLTHTPKNILDLDDLSDRQRARIRRIFRSVGLSDDEISDVIAGKDVTGFDIEDVIKPTDPSNLGRVNKRRRVLSQIMGVLTLDQREALKARPLDIRAEDMMIRMFVRQSGIEWDRIKHLVSVNESVREMDAIVKQKLSNGGYKVKIIKTNDPKDPDLGKELPVKPNYITKTYVKKPEWVSAYSVIMPNGESLWKFWERRLLEIPEEARQEQITAALVDSPMSKHGIHTGKSPGLEQYVKTLIRSNAYHKDDVLVSLYAIKPDQWIALSKTSNGLYIMWKAAQVESSSHVSVSGKTRHHYNVVAEKFPVEGGRLPSEEELSVEFPLHKEEYNYIVLQEYNKIVDQFKEKYGEKQTHEARAFSSEIAEKPKEFPGRGIPSKAEFFEIPAEKSPGYTVEQEPEFDEEPEPEPEIEFEPEPELEFEPEDKEVVESLEYNAEITERDLPGYIAEEQKPEQKPEEMAQYTKEYIGDEDTDANDYASKITDAAIQAINSLDLSDKQKRHIEAFWKVARKRAEESIAKTELDIIVNANTPSVAKYTAKEIESMRNAAKEILRKSVEAVKTQVLTSEQREILSKRVEAAKIKQPTSTAAEISSLFAPEAGDAPPSMTVKKPEAAPEIPTKEVELFSNTDLKTIGKHITAIGANKFHLIVDNFSGTIRKNHDTAMAIVCNEILKMYGLTSDNRHAIDTMTKNISHGLMHNLREKLRTPELAQKHQEQIASQEEKLRQDALNSLRWVVAEVNKKSGKPITISDKILSGSANALKDLEREIRDKYGILDYPPDDKKTAPTPKRKGWTEYQK